MPFWILIHGILFTTWALFWLVLYNRNLWTLSTLFSKEISFKIVVFHLFPLTWLSSSIILGIIKFITRPEYSTDFYMLIVVPLIIILVIIFDHLAANIKTKQNDNKLKDNMQRFKEHCQNWILQFPFINENQYELEVFISKERPVGRMIVYELTETEASLLKKHEEELPCGLKLLFFNK